MTDDDDRLAALEQRVADLERARQRPVSAHVPDPDVFWALDGLQERVGEPGAVLLTGAVTLPDRRVARWQSAAGTDELLDEDWSDHADVFAALGHPVRLRLLGRVLSGVGTANDLMDTEGVGTSGQVYHHLRQLVAAGWLRAVGGGRYEVPVARVVPLLVLVMGARR
ncbi:helix-turn-helix transcriptional regulator [Cellulomonas sp. Leaf334]|uniref:ArsR/SmtB family transcription factor n=1 Tax=Cellulomonas sp. Leaf334 TaxID=1736339 RepID=UPI0006FB3ECB|nr:helix-turn-helix domain-containing protein [Cellulomonas sp. Leaf334]KQR10384.1 ArsR family transcriptional regulator [Cellulomonas sp. Leaf334]